MGQNSIKSSFFCAKGKQNLGHRSMPSAGARSRPAQGAVSFSITLKCKHKYLGDPGKVSDSSFDNPGYPERDTRRDERTDKQKSLCLIFGDQVVVVSLHSSSITLGTGPINDMEMMFFFQDQKKVKLYSSLTKPCRIYHSMALQKKWFVGNIQT